MDLLIILTYVAFAWAMFKIFKLQIIGPFPQRPWVAYLLSVV